MITRDWEGESFNRFAEVSVAVPRISLVSGTRIGSFTHPLFQPSGELSLDAKVLWLSGNISELAGIGGQTVELLFETFLKGEAEEAGNPRIVAVLQNVRFGW